MTQGGKVGQLSLAFGANDMGSVMIEENVVRAAGASYCMDEVEIVRNIEDAGFAAKRRNMHYEILGDPIFRERDVPRMLELATAREDGDTSVPDELRELSGAQPRPASSLARHPQLIRYHAAWILPISEPPIRDGWVAVDRGRVVALGAAGDARARRTAREVVDLGDVAVLPGLVNAHTHLELSYLRDEVPPASQFVDLDPRRDGGAARSGPIRARREILDARRRARSPKRVACGTALVGDISNTLVDRSGRSRAAALAAVVFYELIRFNAPDPDGVVARGAAPSSTRWRRPSACAPASRRTRRTRWRRWCFAAIRAGGRSRAVRAVQRPPVASRSRRSSSSAAAAGRGARCSRSSASWDPAWVPPGGTPVQFLDDSGFLDARRARGARRADDDGRSRSRWRRAARRSSPVRAATATPAPARRRSRTSTTPACSVAVGTDSLASAPDLNVFAELATMRALAPTVPARGAARQRDARRARARSASTPTTARSSRASRARLLAVDAAAGHRRCGRIPGGRNRARARSAGSS